MNPPAQFDDPVAQLSAQLNQIVRALRWLCALAIIVASIPNILDSLAILHFEQIFHDALPGQPLPSLTLILFAARPFFIAASLLWPITGVLIVSLVRRVDVFVVVSIVIFAFVSAQLLITTFGLFLPMTSLVSGMTQLPSGN